MTAVTLAASEPVSAYETLFIERLASQVERAPKPLMALDCRCGNGFTTRALFSSLPPGSRVVAIGEDRAELDVFHRTLEPALRPAIFVRKESALRLPFDEGVFDLAWASLATGRLPDDPRPLLRQLVRALRPPGQLLIATPLRETVVELRSAVTARLGQDDAKVRAMVQEDTPLWSGKEWQDAFRRAGATEVGVARAALTLRIEKPIPEQTVFVEHVLPLWLGPLNPFQDQVLTQLQERLEGPLEVPLHIACIHGRKARPSPA